MDSSRPFLILFFLAIVLPVVAQPFHDDKIDSIVSLLSLKEKIGQTSLRGTSSRVKGGIPEELKNAVRKGEVGALLNVMNPAYVDELQRIAVDESPHGIPLIFSRDVIHGFKTIFPIPLGLAASWSPEVAETCARISAIEASQIGIRWTFAPMLDIARDSRWGRIAESPGEDPYLASLLAKAYVDGFHGEDLKDPTSMAACAKHIIGYGAAVGGRDYNSAIIHEPLLKNIYAPPFAAAIKAGAPTVMSSFNEINGVPASGSKFLLTDILRGELKFNGFVVSDWNSVTGMIDHGFARDEKHSAELSANAGLDMEMTSRAYEHHLEKLIEEGKLQESQLNFFVKNILRVKSQLGLFDNPYRTKTKPIAFYSPQHLKKAKEAVIKSSVLLKNEGILPLAKNKKIALIGPLADAPREQLGTWTFDGEADRSITPLKAFQQGGREMVFSKGLNFSRDYSEEGFEEAVKVAEKSDVIVFIGGEEAILSGEAHSRADISLPGAQEILINRLATLGKPIVLVLMAGRPITIPRIVDKVDAVLMCWHPGTMGGPAIEDIIFGQSEPGGRLPVSWPKTAGQLPLFYNHKNTGRPPVKEEFVHIDDIPVGAWQSSLGNSSHYLDAGFEAHFPFGYGLGYSTYKYENLVLSKASIDFNEELTVSVKLTNTGSRAGEEVVQLYIQDIVGSITRPVRELKGFKRVFLQKGETKKVSFKLSFKDLEFVDNKLEKKAEPGMFNVWLGPDSYASGLKASFSLTR